MPTVYVYVYIYIVYMVTCSPPQVIICCTEWLQLKCLPSPSPLLPPPFIPPLPPPPNPSLFSQRLPVMAEDLIDHNLPYGQGSSLVGSKVREVVAINLQSGKVGPQLIEGWIV